LWAQIISWCESELLTIPEGSVVASMVVYVSDVDIEHNSAKKLSQGLVWIGKPGPDYVGQIWVGGVSCEHLIKSKES
jgi:hypothetical protein